MGNMKLLDKPLKAYTRYAMLVLLASIPVDFLMVDWIWIHEVNEHNLIVSESTKQNLKSLQLSNAQLDQATKLWNQLTPETRLHEVEKLAADSNYTIYRKNTYIPNKGFDRYHGLVSYFELNGRFYSITVETNVEESYETIFGITAITVVFFIILLVGFIKLNKRISGRLWKPFYQTLEKMRSFDLSNHKNIAFEPSNIVEFEEMNAEINKLIIGNVSAYNQQKEFTENASHELQTPLAIVQSKLDILLQDPSLTNDQSAIIEETNNALSRISRINKNLLLLAKIDNQQFMDKETFNVLPILKDLLKSLSVFAADKPIHLTAVSEPVIEGNKMLVDIMLTNLLMNAIRHTGNDAEIVILLDGNQLSISNQGETELDSARLFQRFGSTSKHTPGSGLGLSIVREICERYGWTISYEYLHNLHTFKVIFK
ncbi:signal transduction histidine kinase [Pedobacter sp. UYP24]